MKFLASMWTDLGTIGPLFAYMQTILPVSSTSTSSPAFSPYFFVHSEGSVTVKEPWSLFPWRIILRFIIPPIYICNMININ